MSEFREDLLTPSLSGETATEPPWPNGAGFAVAFLGGGAAIGLFGFFNSRRMHPDRPDWLVLALGLLATIVVGPLLFDLGLHSDGALANRQVRKRINQVLALLIWGASWYRHKDVFKGWELGGKDFASGWKPAIGSILAGIAIATASVAVVGAARGWFEETGE